MSSVKASVRFFLLGLSCLVAVIVQSIVLRFTRGPVSYIYPQFWHKTVLALFGVRLIVEGAPVRDRQVMYVSNHMSYMDIPVLGSLVRGSLVSRGDVKDWPGWGFFGTLQQTAYISRNRTDTLREKHSLGRLVGEGKNLIVFAEGTSNDGASMLPFKSSLFSLATENNLTVQPITMALLAIDGKPAKSQAQRDLYAWYGDMTLPPHFWQIAKLRGAKVLVRFHPPRAPSGYPDRKSLATACQDDVARGLETALAPLRQLG